MRNIAFFNVGRPSSYSDLFCKSVKHTYRDIGGCNLIHISCPATPKLAGADLHIKVSGIDTSYLMYSRMLAYEACIRTLNEPVTFIDDDMLLLRPFSIDHFSNTLCTRTFNKNYLLPLNQLTAAGELNYPEHQNQTIGGFYPYVGCFLHCTDSTLLRDAISIYNKLDDRYKRWYGDQLVLKEVAAKFSCDFISEHIVACLPESIGTINIKLVQALHFKGARKKLIKPYYDLLYYKHV